ncbi:large conductance mechanosensitive channel protein MscL [Neoactinobaculum massilliense]|uniref:large conductance mechanosensitive channel protein MscL n=1 Tax=Neoactinobaculum massilliense TaxID=2364794 RepID=UPI000F529E30|nr:large conductance mechanosensitive channel protein MscL [Neoactinobaculum massilliense]
MLNGFKKFIMQGNPIDVAVGFIIGAAFSGIVTALTEKVLMPILAGLFGQPNFDSVLQFHIHDSLVQPGAIITALINFLLVAAALYFCLVAPMNAYKERHAKPAEAPADSAEVAVLKEIRDRLSSAHVTAPTAAHGADGAHAAN